MRKTAIALAACSMFALTPAANATVTITGNSTVGTTVLNQSPDGSFAFLYGDGNLANPFNEVLEFMTTVGGVFTISANSDANFDGGPNDIDFGTLTMTGPNGFMQNLLPTLAHSDEHERYLLNNVNIGPGTYRLGLNGSSNGANGVFSGNAALTAAVPEPATWAMMLLGFGAIGMAMRRRNAAQPKVNYNFA